MPGLTNPPGFGDTEWGEDRWARARGMNGPRHLVADAASWRPSASTTNDRTINIAAGAATVANGAVYDVTSGGGDSVQVETNLTATVRFDVIVARWDWATKARTFAAVKGSSVPPLINSGPAPSTSQVNRIVGAMYDGAIALVRVRPSVGILSADDVTDLRLMLQGGTVRSFSDYLRFADLSTDNLVIVPGGLARVTNGGDSYSPQWRGAGRRWSWGGVGYNWYLNNGSWNKAPGSEGRFDTVSGHSYLISSKFSINPVSETPYIPWRFSIQVGAQPPSNSVYGTILEEIEGVTKNDTTPMLASGIYYAAVGGPTYVAGMLAVAGPTRIAHNFTSPSTSIVDLGPTPLPGSTRGM